MYSLYLGDCLSVMATLPEHSVDAIVTDPPYGLSFMGKHWDHGVPGVEFWRAALRVIKPGGYLLAFGGTRTWHRLGVAIEDAGWELRDTVAWIYGQGFPKSLDVSKAIDKAAGAENIIGHGVRSTNAFNDRLQVVSGYRPKQYQQRAGEHYPITAPATPAAQQWAGWGTALKPAFEPVIMARAPLSEGTVAANVLKWGTGAINVDGGRVGVSDTDKKRAEKSTRGPVAGKGYVGDFGLKANYEPVEYNPAGRWPANVIHDGSAEVTAGFPQTTSGGRDGWRVNSWTANGRRGIATEVPSPRDGDTGSAARFFYCAKASKRDREEGLEDMQLRRGGAMEANVGDVMGLGVASLNGEHKPRQLTRNHHPTVKPTALMRYLCRLVTPPGGVVLDPFAGSGSTGKGAILEGFSFIGIELEPEYIEIARRRLDWAERKPRELELE